MTNPFNLTNHFLIAMPNMQDPHFVRAVAYIAEHNQDGALGIVINHPTDLSLSQILDQMEIQYSEKQAAQSFPVLYGGPVHQERGFVVHRPCGKWGSTFAPSEEVNITTSKDILQAIAESNGPEKAIITLGYAGWGAGQIETEISQNTWLTCPSNTEILFETPFKDCWEKALRAAGIDDISKLSNDIGHG